MQPADGPPRPRAVVVGGGPSGCLASMLLAQQGWHVSMLELRDRDSAVGGLSKMRSWCLGMFPRGINAVTKAVPDAYERHFRDRTFKYLIMHKPDGSPMYTAGRTGALCHRFGIAALLTEAMEESGLVQPMYGAQFVGADFAARTATFEVAEPATSSGNSTQAGDSEEEQKKKHELVLPYDLLVGADGSSSGVRGALVEAFPSQMRVKMVSQSKGKIYKTFYGMPPDPLTLTWEPKCHVVGPAPSMEEMAAAAAAGKPLRWPAGGTESDPGISFHPFRGSKPGVGIALSLDVDTNTYSGFFPTSDELMPSPHDSEEVWLKLIGEALVPPLPASWQAPLAKQLAQCPVSRFPNVQCTSSLSVPGAACALIGDAAHCVTPMLGQGMNSALEDAALLAEEMRSVRTGAKATAVAAAVESALSRYESSRLPEIRALMTLELRMRMGTETLIHGTWLEKLLCKLFGGKPPTPLFGSSGGTMYQRAGFKLYTLTKIVMVSITRAVLGPRLADKLPWVLNGAPLIEVQTGEVSYIAMVRMLDTYSLVAATTTLGIATLAGRAMYRRMAQ